MPLPPVPAPSRVPEFERKLEGIEEASASEAKEAEVAARRRLEDRRRRMRTRQLQRRDLTELRQRAAALRERLER